MEILGKILCFGLKDDTQIISFAFFFFFNKLSGPWLGHLNIYEVGQ